MMYRWMDFLVALFLLIILFPIMIIISILVYIKLGTPIFFKQQRPGWHEKPFYIYKFRTMHIPKNQDNEILGDKSRSTKFGNLLRRLSLDELPQLLNIIKGDISFVGPRPLLMEHLKLYTSEQKRRHDVRPGITGWAQVNGRNSISWDKKLELDIWYVDNKSFWLDLKILFKTAIVVIRGKDIEYKQHTTGLNK